MPTYEFKCEQCGDFEAVRSIAKRNDLCHCPWCEAPAERVIASATMLTTSMTAGNRNAYATNERASHEPKLASAHVHSPSCGCGSGKSKTTAVAADGSKAFPTKRPWMISH